MVEGTGSPGPLGGPVTESIEVVPLVVIAQTFPARPSSIPDIRDFVRRCLDRSPLNEEDTRAVGATVSQALLDAAGPTGTIQVSFRIFPDHVEVDVLRSYPAEEPGGPVDRQAPANTRAACAAIRAAPCPAPAAERQHRLKHELAWGVHAGVRLEQWQYEVTSGARVWYLLNHETHTVWLVYASPRHPRETDR
jgi:hypothetical protein